PVRQFRARFVRALAEIENCLFRRLSRTRIVVLEDKLTQLLIPVSALRTYGFIGETGRRGCRVRVKGGMEEPAIARPEAATGNFMRIAFAHHRIHVRLFRRLPSGKTRDGQIERTPEEMNRAALADKT